MPEYKLKQSNYGVIYYVFFSGGGRKCSLSVYVTMHEEIGHSYAHNVGKKLF